MRPRGCLRLGVGDGRRDPASMSHGWSRPGGRAAGTEVVGAEPAKAPCPPTLRAEPAQHAGTERRALRGSAAGGRLRATTPSAAACSTATAGAATGGAAGGPAEDPPKPTSTPPAGGAAPARTSSRTSTGAAGATTEPQAPNATTARAGARATGATTAGQTKACALPAASRRTTRPAATRRPAEQTTPAATGRAGAPQSGRTPRPARGGTPCARPLPPVPLPRGRRGARRPEPGDRQPRQTAGAVQRRPGQRPDPAERGDHRRERHTDPVDRLTDLLEHTVGVVGASAEVKGFGVVGHRVLRSGPVLRRLSCVVDDAVCRPGVPGSNPQVGRGVSPSVVRRPSSGDAADDACARPRA